jgi:2-dehydropantoate 2-reductase
METRTNNEEHRVMRIAVMGAGGVGGYYGARLAHAGHDVTFIARGEHLRAVKAHGLALRGPAGDILVSAAQATDDPRNIAPVDVVLFCVKLFDTEDAARACQPLLENGGLCVSLQNGVDGQHRINAVLGTPVAIGGLAFVSAVIESPGVIRYVSTSPSIQFGEADGRASARTTRFREACIAAGFGAEVVPDIRAAQWRKFVGLTTNAALTSIARQPAGVVYHDPDLLALARAGFSEAAAVAKAGGVELPADFVEQNVEKHRKFPAGMYASMYHDLARGRRLELESLSGLIVREGREHAIPTPFHAFAYACLKPYVNGAPAAPAERTS